MKGQPTKQVVGRVIQQLGDASAERVHQPNHRLIRAPLSGLPDFIGWSFCTELYRGGPDRRGHAHRALLQLVILVLQGADIAGPFPELSLSLSQRFLACNYPARKRRTGSLLWGCSAHPAIFFSGVLASHTQRGLLGICGGRAVRGKEGQRPGTEWPGTRALARNAAWGTAVGPNTPNTPTATSRLHYCLPRAAGQGTSLALTGLGGSRGRRVRTLITANPADRGEITLSTGAFGCIFGLGVENVAKSW